MIQRNFNLVAIQEFIKAYDNSDISILVIDRAGKTIAHSDKIQFINEDDDLQNGRYKYIADEIKDFSGTLRLKIDGEDVIANYSRNWTTDWIIITVQPYKQILNQVYAKIFETTSLGIAILIILFIIAYAVSTIATRPIQKITDATDKIVSGKGNIEQIELDTDDEFGQIAIAFNKIRSSRDAYQMEAETNTLTKLYNKTTTENIGRKKIREYLEGNNKDCITAFFIIDLDHFKEANDTRGHQFGDKVLIEFAKNLRKKFRPTDCIGRFGGDEFVIILDKIPSIEVVIRKARDIKNVAENLIVDGTPAGITASIGIAIIPQDGTDYETAFKAADNALYHVKSNGRNGFYYRDAEGIS
jgi:diguanylate cyclase (GGDEF)-like protein